MKIDRHNYEEFFILYMDNELTEAERRMVDLFVSHHPDLKEELEQLLQTRFSPDPSALYHQKDSLFKQSTGISITITNYEEWVLSYIDEELTPDAEKKVELFVSTNPAAQLLLQQLQQAKNQPETSIVFPDKEVLYRSAEEEEKPVKPLFMLRWWRIAAAVVVLLGLSIGLTSILRDGANHPVTPLAQTDPIKETNKQDLTTVPDKNTTLTQEQPVAPSLDEHTIPAKSTTTEYMAPESTVIQNKKNTAGMVVNENDQQTLFANSTITQEENTAAYESFKKNLSTALTSETKDALTNHKEIYSHPVVTPAMATSLDIQAASFVPADTEDVATQAGSKNKLRGFFRKLTRSFEKATNIKATDDEDRLLIAGLAIQL